jgi:hypothetical protein
LSASTSAGGITVSVIRDPAVGAIVLTMMLRFLPSSASVWLRPCNPSLAIE